MNLYIQVDFKWILYFLVVWFLFDQKFHIFCGTPGDMDEDDNIAINYYQVESE